MLGVEALLLLLPAFVGILYGEEKRSPVICDTGSDSDMHFCNSRKTETEGQVIYGKEGMVVVASAFGSHGPYSEHFHLHCLEVFRIL